jgi:hypothetical protein
LPREEDEGAGIAPCAERALGELHEAQVQQSAEHSSAQNTAASAAHSTVRKSGP